MNLKVCPIFRELFLPFPCAYGLYPCPMGIYFISKIDKCQLYDDAIELNFEPIWKSIILMLHIAIYVFSL